MSSRRRALFTGSNQPQTYSYYIDSNGITHYFDLENTPIAGLCPTGAASNPLMINGQTVPKNNIRVIVFGKSYNSITIIPNYFIYTWVNLISIDYSGLKNAATIGNSWMRGCTSLQHIDLSPFASVMSIDGTLLYQSTGLKSIQIGNVDWSSRYVNTVNIMTGIPNVSTSVLRADTQNLATAFKTKMNGMISNWTIVVN
jgi:hypothetical protein